MLTGSRESAEISDFQMRVAAEITTFLVTAIGCMLLAAGVQKVLQGSDNVLAVIDSYNLLRPRLAETIALGLPWLEICLGVCLIVGALPVLFRIMSALVLVAFGGSMVVNLVHGRRDIDCGCLHGSRQQTISWFLVLRNFALAGILVLSLVMDPLPSEPFVKVLSRAVLGGMILGAAVLLQMSVEFIRSSRGGAAVGNSSTTTEEVG